MKSVKFNMNTLNCVLLVVVLVLVVVYCTKQSNEDFKTRCSEIIGKRNCNSLKNDCLWNRKKKICDGTILEKKTNSYIEGPKEGTGFYNSWVDNNKCGFVCTSDRPRHKKIRTKALQKMKKDNICELGICKNCDLCRMTIPVIKPVIGVSNNTKPLIGNSTTTMVGKTDEYPPLITWAPTTTVGKTDEYPVGHSEPGPVSYSSFGTVSVFKPKPKPAVNNGV